MSGVKIEEVTWHDHYDDSEPVELGKVRMMPWVHTTVGYIVAEDEHMLAIAQTHRFPHVESKERYEAVTYIVKSAIAKRRTLPSK